ncbi:unnamed protein product, partial [Vitrella brassicaformis CCMP3155]
PPPEGRHNSQVEALLEGLHNRAVRTSLDISRLAYKVGRSNTWARRSEQTARRIATKQGTAGQPDTPRAPSDMDPSVPPHPHECLPRKAARPAATSGRIPTGDNVQKGRSAIHARTETIPGDLPARKPHAARITLRRPVLQRTGRKIVQREWTPPPSPPADTGDGWVTPPFDGPASDGWISPPSSLGDPMETDEPQGTQPGLTREKQERIERNRAEAEERKKRKREEELREKIAQGRAAAAERKKRKQEERRKAQEEGRTLPPVAPQPPPRQPSTREAALNQRAINQAIHCSERPKRPSVVLPPPAGDDRMDE